ncbi:histone H3.v1-like [Phymastichus coffea]|uniref:histone H3.v1-like n=1 Tax=Phymastichus coffea TaxID=108790 RepID=UPI00273B3A67|nr:histone H3.v1-like [Phymastichus coffea]
MVRTRVFQEDILGTGNIKNIDVNDTEEEAEDMEEEEEKEAVKEEEEKEEEEKEEEEKEEEEKEEEEKEEEEETVQGDEAVIQGTSTFYFDIEFQTKQSTLNNGELYVANLIEFFKSFIQQLLQIEVAKIDRLVLDASDAMKFSKHIIFHMYEI